ncbi:sodium:solute symporter family protein [Arcticibacterium luteifluviistationis]|uniref:Sodium:solute symporter n=1 Tax=Arcticibacterium luteifluviistationis TaxID=1784714 RepID=A0A2Z4GCJ2_9BACT|nr:sodium:solute symporter family protein [Arcticibacterium luteifluviistationis]AWV98755.1 sodium:solute symporter [Arcticibacterium luteifluviistationis]
MKLTLIDVSIILLYLIATVVIGLVLKKKAERSKSDYLLGGNKIPWYYLGLSNASGMFDISGTMWLVTLLFVYGLKSAWIPFLWPVFNQIFLMVFLSIWLRKSNVTTGAEWINTRFSGKGAALSHSVIVVFAIILGMGYLAYGFIGIGKFVEIFVPWELISAYVPFDVSPEYVPHFYGIIFTCFAVFYSLLGGMMSIVWTDILQYALLMISGIVIGIIAMNAVATYGLNVPDGWLTPFFGKRLDLDWTHIIPEVNAKIESDGYNLFSLFFMMMLMKGLLVSFAGPAPTYDMQKILSSRSPREAALISGSVSAILMPLRYFMIAGFAALALIFYERLDLVVGGEIDFEQILPSAIHEFVPVGFLGLLLAGLLAAFMSTFAGTLNATQAYLVNDIFLKHINPKASNRTIKYSNWLAGIAMVLVSLILGFYARDVNDILQWIVSGLYGSYVVSNMLKWYWWRFNGTGFFWGMVGGLVPALSFRFIFEGVLDLYTFPLMLFIALLAAVAGTYAAPATEEKTLKSFYKNITPWGFWKPIREKVMAEDPEWEGSTYFKRDMFNVFVGIVWQTSLVIFPMYLVFLEVVPFFITLGVTVLCTLILKRTWFDTLPKD